MRPQHPFRSLVVAGFAFLAAAAPAHATSGMAISVSPSRLVLDGASQTLVAVTNSGSVRARIDVGLGNYVILADGRVRIDPKLPPGRSAKRWLTATPRRLDIDPGQTRIVAVRARPTRSAAPGDHHALLLLTAAARSTGTVAVRTRVGVTTLVRVRGPLVRDLRRRGVSMVRTGKAVQIRVHLQNRGNVNERIEAGRTFLTLRNGGRVVARLRAATRSILPGTSGYLVFSYRGTARGLTAMTATIRPASGAEAGPGVARVPAPIVVVRRLRL